MIQIIYLALVFYLVQDYIKHPSRFKFFIAPLVIVSYMSATNMYDSLDNRTVILIYILTFISTVYYINAYWKLYKLERYQEKVRQREE